MKITRYKVPVTITRDAGGEVNLEMHEDQKVEQGSTPVPEDEKNTIPNLAKELADRNSNQLSLAKSMLLSRESTQKSFVTLEYLE